MSGPHVVYVG